MPGVSEPLEMLTNAGLFEGLMPVNLAEGHAGCPFELTLHRKELGLFLKC